MVSHFFSLYTNENAADVFRFYDVELVQCVWRSCSCRSSLFISIPSSCIYSICMSIYMTYIIIYFLAPTAPFGLEATHIGTTSVVISWHKPHGNITGYQVSFTLRDANACFFDVAGENTSTELASLQPQTEYTICVRARTEDFGNYSSQITIQTLSLEDGEMSASMILFLIMLFLVGLQQYPYKICTSWTLPYYNTLFVAYITNNKSIKKHHFVNACTNMSVLTVLIHISCNRVHYK